MAACVLQGQYPDKAGLVT